MDSAQKTLIDIASASQRIVTSLTRDTGQKTVETFRIDRIIIGSRSVLEILNKELLLEDGCVDARLVDWLNSSEPQACLDTLNQMEQILNKKVEYSTRSFFKAAQSARTQDKSDEAIRLFQVRQAYFHFLLNTDIWNRERNLYRQSHTSVEGNAQEVAPEIPNPKNPTRRDSEHTSRVPQENIAKQAEKLKTVLGQLDALHCEDIHGRTLRLRQPDTCTWLPKESGFKKWKETRDSFLWLRGKAGAGKSVLAASVIEHLEDTLQDGQTLIFFYCDFRNGRSINTIEIMRSLLSQLLQQFCRHAIESKGLIDDLEKDATSIIGNIDLLARYISRAARQSSQQPFCIIDALDECNDLEELLDVLRQLKGGGIRFLVTSRPLQIIREGLAGLPSISMDTMKAEVAADISLHVEREIDSHRRLRILETSLKDEIGSALCHKADGMFRWVHCQLNTLKRCMTAAQIWKALDDLPRDLDTTYSRILLRIDENELDVVRQALYWLVAALEPLELCQILDGLSIDIEKRVLDRNSAPVHGPALLDALGSLVSYNESTDLVILSHASVKEYLTAVTIRSKYPLYHIDEQSAHTKLALLCMSYIPAYFKHYQQVNVHAVHPQDDCGSRICTHGFNTTSHAIRHCSSAVPPPPECYPLLAYVQTSGFGHLKYVDPADRKVLHAIKVFESDVQLHPIEWERFREGFGYIQWPSLGHDLVSYILVAFAPAQLLRLHIGHSQLTQKDGTNPLVYAALLNKMDHATILLSKGGLVEQRGWDLDGQDQVLPLMVVRKWDEQMFDLLLTEGSPVPYELFERVIREDNHSSPSLILKMMQTDEFVEWAATHDKDFLLGVLRPEFSDGPSSEEVFEAMERRLTQIGCDPSVWLDKMSLHDAVNADHIPTVKRLLFDGYVSLHSDAVLHAKSREMMHFLLDLGNDIHVVSSEGDTLLHRVIKWPTGRYPNGENLHTIQALIRTGCNPFTCNWAGETPLHIAASQGERSTVEYLLSLGVPLPPNILLAAFNFSVIFLLLSEGADVQAIAANGDTVLHTALRHHYSMEVCLEVAKLLINAGCNPRSPNALGETPLHVAVKSGHTLVVQYLLSLGVPLPSDILLSVIDGYCTTSLIEFLLDNGADVHAMSPSGHTLLFLLLDTPWTSEECLKKVKILVNAGCDPYICNNAGESFIHKVTEKKLTTVVEYLVSLGLPAPIDLNFDEGSQSRDYGRLLENGSDVCAILEDEDAMWALTDTEEAALYLAQHLIKSGCSPSSGQEPLLHLAARRGYISVISYFLSLGAPLPSDILLSATQWNHRDTANVIRYLIQHGANVDATSPEDGTTPFHKLLVELSEPYDRDYLLQSTQILVEAGCNPSSQDLYGKTPMYLAAWNGYTSIIKYLVSQGIPPPHHILVDSSVQAFRFFLRNGVKVQSLIPVLPLHHVLNSFSYYDIEADCLEFIVLLISAGCDPSVENWLGETPIHIAARNRHISVIEYLLSQNATLPSNVLLPAVLQWNAWDYAKNTVVLFRLLIHKGADANASTDDGDTLLHLVLRHFVDLENEARSHDGRDRIRERCRCLEVLLNGGANPFKKNAEGKNAFHLAEERGQPFKDNFLRLVLKVHRMDITRRDTYQKTLSQYIRHPSRQI